ncbi:branched-chain amino acid aminotransferase [Crocinitomicaceae bacterium]|nr:branched-chain amino acid aminotransferase [Crocinitomicaceae bacterium]
MLSDQFEIKINKTSSTRINDVDWDNLPFGKVFSDHMLVMEYSDGQWHTPEISEFKNLSMHPASSVLHYGQTIFEGMKANRSVDGDVLVFRPEMNARRFAESCGRMCMPVVPEELFIECIRRVIEIDNQWIPQREGYSLYIRPFILATDEYIGIKPSDTYKFIIFTCPVGAYYSEPVNVKIEDHYTRAAEGGVGRAKTAGNYAASLYPSKLAQKAGFHQLLWTDGKEHKYIEEAGTMNVCFIINDVLITPSEESDTILRGVTKRSVVELAQSWGIQVEERKVSVEEVVNAARSGTLQDAFGAGTAATIVHIAKLGYGEEIYELPSIESRTISNRIKEELNDIKSGKKPDEMNWCLRIK